MANQLAPLFSDRDLIAFNGVESRLPLDYVHPWRRRDLEKIIKNVPDTVDMIIVYGSSLGDYLRDDSDLDIAVISKDRTCYNRSLLAKMELDTEVDVQIFPSFNELLEQAEGFFPTPRAIVTEGLPVYVKNTEVEVI